MRVAWGLARRYGPTAGLERLIDGIREIASRAGRPDAYHFTITRAWFDLISSVDDLAQHAELFDKALLERYYSPAQLAAGREHWLEPDLHPLRLPPPTPPTMDVPSVLRKIPTPVAVLGARVGETVHATTVTSITCVSRVPALVSVSIASGSRTLELLDRADSFTLSVLASGMDDLTARFANGARAASASQFAGVPHHMTAFGPVLSGSAVRLGCDVHAKHECGDHHLLVGAIRSADVSEGLHPLVQHDGTFH